VTDSPGLSAAAFRLLEAIALRARVADAIDPPGGAAVLRSIVDAAVALFDAEAASIALHDPATDRLVFRVAAGERGQGVVGISIGANEGIAGYVFTTGQPIAIADVSADPRFGATAAQRTGYVPRSLLAVPLVDDDESLGVLEILDRRGSTTFDLRDIELAGVFARQATVAIRATRLERDTAALLAEALRSLPVGGADDQGSADAASDEIVSAVIDRLDLRDEDPVWHLADRIARLRHADPDELTLLTELLDVLIRRSDRGLRGRDGARSRR